MTGLERFLRTVNRQPVDHPAVWLGIPDDSALHGLFRYFGAEDMAGLKTLLDDDVWPVELPYRSPTSQHIYAAFDFAKEGAADPSERTLTHPGFFEDCDDPADVERFDWPDPARYIDPAACRAAVEAVPEGKAALGVLWSAHFQDTCAAFGMETALMNMIANPALYKAVDRRILDFYLAANEIFFENTRGKLHAVLIGNDMGSQQGLMLSPEMIREFVLPGAAELIRQAHSYGVKVIYHSCGAVSEIFSDLIEAGADILHPIQALAAGMEPEGLRERFGGRVSFCGGVDAQELLVNGTPEQVAEKVRALRELFPTGLIISPSHEAILADTPPANVEALIRTAQEKGNEKETLL